MGPNDRATLEWAMRVVHGQDPDVEIYVTRSGDLLWGGDLSPVSLSSDFLAVTLAQMLKLRRAGVEFAELRRDLVASGTREKVADVLCNHLQDVSVEEWRRLNERVAWYDADNASLIRVSTDEQGDSS